MLFCDLKGAQALFVEREGGELTGPFSSDLIFVPYTLFTPWVLCIRFTMAFAPVAEQF